MKINFLNIGIYKQLWIHDRKDICNSKKGVKHVCPCQRLQVGFLHEVVGWDEALHLWTKSERNLSITSGLEKKRRYWSDDRNWAWTAFRYGLFEGPNPKTSNMRSGLNCTAWMTGWGNYETNMKCSWQWAL